MDYTKTFIKKRWMKVKFVIISFLLLSVTLFSQEREMVIERKGIIYKGAMYKPQLKISTLLETKDLKKNTPLYVFREMISAEKENDYKKFKSIYYKLDDRMKARGLTESAFKEKYFKGLNDFKKMFIKNAHIRSYVKFKDYIVLLIMFESNGVLSPCPFFFKKIDGKLYMDMLVGSELMKSIGPYMEYEMENPPANLNE